MVALTLVVLMWLWLVIAMVKAHPRHGDSCDGGDHAGDDADGDDQHHHDPAICKSSCGCMKRHRFWMFSSRTVSLSEERRQCGFACSPTTRQEPLSPKSRPLRFRRDVRSVMKAAPALKLSWTLSPALPCCYQLPSISRRCQLDSRLSLKPFASVISAASLRRGTGADANSSRSSLKPSL